MIKQGGMQKWASIIRKILKEESGQFSIGFKRDGLQVLIFRCTNAHPCVFRYRSVQRSQRRNNKGVQII